MSRIFTLGLMESVPSSSSLGTKELYDKVGHNTGNLAFHYAINRLLGITPRSISWSATAEEIDSCGDLAIMPCANQLGPHVDMRGFSDTFGRISSKVVAIGLGAQSSVNRDIPVLPTATIDWVHQIVDRAPSKHPNITVRGDFTKDVMDHYGFAANTISLGCPTLFLNKSRDLGATLGARYRMTPRKVAIAAGHPNWLDLSLLEASLVRIMEDTHGAYVIQATDELIALSRNEFPYVEPDFLRELQSYLRLNLTQEQFIEWVRRYFISFYSIPSWMEYLRRFDFIVGARIHGVMLGIQAGIPGLCIAHDSRIVELCQKCMIPYVLASDVRNGIVLSDLRELSNFDGKAFDRNREEIIAHYQTFFSRNGFV